jgi:hypothetical protein
MAEAHPSARLEIYFSIVQRKALTPNDFKALPEFASHLMDLTQHSRTLARSFEWTFTRAKLDSVIEKITRHGPQPLALVASLADTSTR